MKLEIKNKRILTFYEKNSNIDFETMNLLLLDIIDQLQRSDSDGISSINSQILSHLNENNVMISNLNNSINDIKENINTINSNVVNSMSLKMLDIKKEYIEDVKSIINCNTIEKMGPLLEKNNDDLIQKTSSVIQTIIPKMDTMSYSQINDTLKTFQKSIIDDTSMLLKNIDNNSMKDFIQNFEIKSSHMLHSLQQPIYSFISSSEERINTNINVLKDLTNLNQSKQLQMTSEINENMLKKSRPPSPQTYQNENTEENLVIALSQLYSTADFKIKKIDLNSASIFMKRPNRSNILLYSIHEERNINQDEISCYTNIVDEYACSGIFVSQNSGIASKSNYNIEIANGNVNIFIHNVNNSSDKIKVAIDVIDILSQKIKQLHRGDNDITIPKDVLDEINKDFQLFMSQKETLMNYIKESNKKILSQIDEMKFLSLDKYLSTKFTPTNSKQGLKCDLCKYFTANNLKALAAHKRGCIRKNTFSIENSIVSHKSPGIDVV